MREPLPLFSRRDRVRIGQFLIVVLLLVLTLPSRAAASANLLANGGLESLAGNGFPVCWEQSGWGDSSYTLGVTGPGHTGAHAVTITVSSISTGDRKAMMLEDPSCAPNVTPGHQYDLSAWYASTSPNTVLTMFRHDVAQGWVYWTDLATLPVTTTWSRQTVRTSPIPRTPTRSPGE